MGAYKHEHGHGHTCIWQVHMGMGGIWHGHIVAWVYGIKFVSNIKYMHGCKRVRWHGSTLNPTKRVKCCRRDA